MHAGSFSSYAAMCAPTAATSYCFLVEHGAHAFSLVPPAGPRFNRPTRPGLATSW